MRSKYEHLRRPADGRSQLTLPSGRSAEYFSPISPPRFLIFASTVQTPLPPLTGPMICNLQNRWQRSKRKTLGLWGCLVFGACRVVTGGLGTSWVQVAACPPTRSALPRAELVPGRRQPAPALPATDSTGA